MTNWSPLASGAPTPPVPSAFDDQGFAAAGTVCSVLVGGCCNPFDLAEHHQLGIDTNCRCNLLHHTPLPPAPCGNIDCKEHKEVERGDVVQT